MEGECSKVHVKGRHVDVRYYPKGNFPGGNFPIVQFPRRPNLWAVAACEIEHLGSCHLEK